MAVGDAAAGVVEARAAMEMVGMAETVETAAGVATAAVGVVVAVGAEAAARVVVAAFPRAETRSGIWRWALWLA